MLSISLSLGKILSKMAAWQQQTLDASNFLRSSLHKQPLKVHQCLLSALATLCKDQLKCTWHQFQQRQVEARNQSINNFCLMNSHRLQTWQRALPNLNSVERVEAILTALWSLLLWQLARLTLYQITAKTTAVAIPSPRSLTSTLSTHSPYSSSTSRTMPWSKTPLRTTTTVIINSVDAPIRQMFISLSNTIWIVLHHQTTNILKANRQPYSRKYRLAR